MKKEEVKEISSEIFESEIDDISCEIERLVRKKLHETISTISDNLVSEYSNILNRPASVEVSELIFALKKDLNSNFPQSFNSKRGYRAGYSRACKDMQSYLDKYIAAFLAQSK